MSSKIVYLVSHIVKDNLAMIHKSEDKLYISFLNFCIIYVQFLQEKMIYLHMYEFEYILRYILTSIWAKC